MSSLGQLLGVNGYASSSEEGGTNDHECAVSHSTMPEPSGGKSDENESSEDEISEEEKLTVPIELQNSFTGGKRPRDDPSLHQNRKRKVEHVVGNYATSVFVPIHVVRVPAPSTNSVSSEEEGEGVADELYPGSIRPALQERCKALLQQFCDAKTANKEFYNIETPHATLNLTNPLKYHFIEPFLTALAKKCEFVDPFPLCFDLSNSQIFRNKEGDRFFAALAVASNRQYLDVLAAVDQVAREFGTFLFSISQ